jgi:hypothetical protein
VPILNSKQLIAKRKNYNSRSRRFLSNLSSMDVSSVLLGDNGKDDLVVSAGVVVVVVIILLLTTAGN